MNSLLNESNEYIGQYIHIKNNEYTVRIFTRLYNLSIGDKNYFIDTKVVKELLDMSKYKVHDANIYVNDPQNDQTILKPLTLGSYAVYIVPTKKLYLLSKQEFKKFIKNNKYKKEVTINFVLGIEDTENQQFKMLNIIQANSLKNAKYVYKKRYNTDKDPVFIGIEEDKYLYIPTDKQVLISKMEQDILIDNI